MGTEFSEASLTPTQAEIWALAQRAATQKNHPYVVGLLKSLLKELPDFLEARKILRNSEISITGGPKKKAGLFGINIQAGPPAKYLNLAKKDPLAAIQAIEEELESDPCSPSLNEALFIAANSCNKPEIAAFALETVRRHHSDNTKLMHVLAKHYLGKEMFEEAAEVYSDIVKQVPTDSDAIKAEKDATAKASMKKQKWEEGASFRSLIKSSSETLDLEKSSRQGMTHEQLEEKLASLGARYAANNQDLAVAREIANTYEQMEDWNNALAFFEYAYTLSSNDISLKNKASSLRDKVNEQIVFDLEKVLAEDPENEAIKEQLEEAKSYRIAKQVEESMARVESNPTDPQLRFELGQALYNAGDFTEAIPQLQRARNNPYLRTRALLLLGKSYEAKNMLDLAVKQLAEANQEIPTMDGIKKDILYTKGCIHEKMDEKEAAIDCFKLIYENDYSYRDVAKRVEGSY